MIPRIAQLGTGFAGAGQYYLHDKRDDRQPQRPSAEDYHLSDKGNAQTSHRVGFTATRNLPTEDPRTALRCMSWLAANAMSVRQAAVAAAAKSSGLSYDAYVRAHNPFRGRKGQKPVFTMSIAWHPKLNKKPTDKEMLDAADQVLRELNLQQHQALIVQHTDTAHPHVHLIVNRVHPTTGLYAKLGNDKLTLSRWAMEFEKKTGLVLCHERVENWKRRDAARAVKAEARQAESQVMAKATGTAKTKTQSKIKGEVITAKNVPRGDHDWFKSVAHLPADQIRQARAARQDREREQFQHVAAKRAARAEQRISRRYGDRLREVETEIERLLRAEGWRKNTTRLSASLILSPRQAFHALVDLFAARAQRRPRKIAALDKVATKLREKMVEVRDAERARQVDARRRMVLRHGVERQRDEDRIDAMGRVARGKGQAERGRKVFNLRGNVETARLVSPKQPLVRLADIHAQIADAGKLGAASLESALGKAIAALGGKVDDARLKRETVGGMRLETDDKQSSAEKAAEELAARERFEAQSEEADGEDRTATASEETPESDSNGIEAESMSDAVLPGQERAAFEERRDAALTRIEAQQAQEKRRRRARPRGKVRRLE